MISIIIPVLHEKRRIRASLHNLARLREIGSAEVIVVDGGEGTTLKATGALKRFFELRALLSPAGRARQMNAGAAASRGEILLFLHADTRLPRDGLVAVERALSRREAGAFDLRIETTNPVLKAISLAGSLRSRVSRIPYGDQAHFFRREAFFRIGGYPDLPLMEDVAIMTRAKHRGMAIAILRKVARTSDRRWRREGILRRTLANDALILAYRAGVSPALLAGWYRSEPDGSAAFDGTESAQREARVARRS